MNELEKIIYHTNPRSYYEISKNPNVTWDIIKNKLNYQLDWENLSRIIPWNIIEQNLDKGKWIWKFISENPTVTWDIIQKNVNKPWNYEHLLLNPNITPEIVQNNRDKSWSFLFIGKNPNFFLQDVKKLCPPGRYMYISFFMENPNIKDDIIDDPLFKYGNIWKYLSKNWNLSSNFIRKYQDKPWDWLELSKNPNLPFDVILKNLDKNMYWYFISQNPSVTWEIYNKYKNISWDLEGLYKNPNIHFDIILKQKINDNVLWYSVCKNPNLTLDIIKKNQEYWNVSVIAKNEFKKDIRYRIMQKNKIIHAYRKHLLRKRLPIVAQKYRINGEIKFMPNRGIEYFKIKEELETLF